jgi:hypothetical protein
VKVLPDPVYPNANKVTLDPLKKDDIKGLTS